MTDKKKARTVRSLFGPGVGIIRGGMRHRKYIASSPLLSTAFRIRAPYSSPRNLATGQCAR